MNCIKWLHIINGLSLVGGIITVIIGVTLLPQTVTNNGDKYIGEADAYNADLQKAQMASYGFKVAIVGLSIIGVNFIALFAISYYMHIQENADLVRVQPQPIQVYESQRRVTISPTVIEIPDDRIGVDKAINIKKWMGNAFIP